MRPILIVCETTHADRIRDGVRRFCHPQLQGQPWIDIFAVDLGVDTEHQRRELVPRLMAALPPRATDRRLVLCTKEVVAPMRLRPLCTGLSVELAVTTSTVLTKHESRDRDPEFLRLLHSNGVSVRGASCELLNGWMHGRIDRAHVDAWIGQFGQLGPFTWMAEAILGEMTLFEQSLLGDRLAPYGEDPDIALCVNVDPLGKFKSAEIIANLLTKRFPDRTVYRSPAAAIEDGGANRLVVFEDGLWSGTEAVGVINSLLGKRNEKPKTRVLIDAAKLNTVDLTFMYGVSTDYGQSLVNRFLTDSKLPNVRTGAVNQLAIATPGLLADLGLEGFDAATLYREGPDSARLRPHLFDTLLRRGMPADRVAQLQGFCATVGRQLFSHYVDFQRAKFGWDAWQDSKLNKAALGYHGLALTHAFGHSIPKASLPLLWASGRVTYDGSRTISWKPLFQNA